MTTTPTLHAQVLALRRTHSARAVAQALSIPLGTVKAISSRAGLTRDNAKLREFFRLPEPTASTSTALQPPVAPPEPVAVTGDRDMDAVLWLRQVVQSGDAGLIAACPTPEGICWTLTNLDTMESAVFRPAALHHT